MATKSETYRKIATQRSLDPQRICLAEDHLLIASGAYVQQYRRMYFRDIEAFSMARNSSFLVTLVFFLIALVTFGGVAWLLREDSRTGALIFLGMAVFSFIVTAIHVARGPTVSCSLRTRVQTIQLPALGREYKALQFQETLQREVERFQEPFAPQRFAELQRHSLEAPPPVQPGRGRRRPPKLP